MVCMTKAMHRRYRSLGVGSREGRAILSGLGEVDRRNLLGRPWSESAIALRPRPPVYLREAKGSR